VLPASDLLALSVSEQRPFVGLLIRGTLLMGGLPPSDTRRWVVSRKAAVVTAVRRGKITREEALRRYQLSEEEFDIWQRGFETYGLRGLRATPARQHHEPHYRARTRRRH
jgi:hypothetical protein